MEIQIPVIDVNGKNVGEVSLPVADSAEDIQARVHQLVKWQDRETHEFLAHTKTRAEVSGSGVKPYKQKGTGRARRGSNRTPLRVGGGITFGPKFRQPNFQINKKELKQAFQALIFAVAPRMVIVKFPENELVRTKSVANGVLKGIRQESAPVTFVVAPEEQGVYKGVRNIGKSETCYANALLANSVLKADHVLVSEVGFRWIKERVLG